MGMFDNVSIPCPRCDNVIEEQSKGARRPDLNNYHLSNIPVNVFSYIAGNEYTCEKCNTTFKIKDPREIRIRGDQYLEVLKDDLTEYD